MKATYSPEDNKLRLYSSERLDPETYAKIKAEGFRWAPKQDLFVAPAWNPARADILTELAGDIGDEDTSLTDRQEQRADRFETYQENRLNDAEAAHEAVNAITDNIPFGQPILVGHHSEKRARKEAERIERGMQKAVKMWETSEYWKERAKGAIRHAKYKERPDVRARRIKKLEAEKRKYEKYISEAEAHIKLWSSPRLERKHALILAGYSYGNIYRELSDEKITLQEAKDKSIEARNETISYYARWVNHTGLRIEYEKAMLDEQGASELLKPKPRPKQLPLLNYRQPEGFDIQNEYSRDQIIHYPQVEMTKAEYKAIYSESKGGREIDGTHRIRIAYRQGGRFSVFLTDSKEHARPEREGVACEQV
jgi:hypothetical protein